MLTTQSFATELRQRSRDEHVAAEQSPLMSALLAGRLSTADYAVLLTQLQAVYSALESATAANRRDPVLGGLFDARLDRSLAITADLAALDAGAVELTPATRAYVDRIAAVAATWPTGLVGHHYTRYLGDLSGGRVIAKVLSRELGLQADRGLAFYDFPAIPSAPAFKKTYRQRLDSAPWSPEDRERLVTEVRTAFDLNRALFASLEYLIP